MANQNPPCADSPEEILESTVCLYEISKDLKDGTLKVVSSDVESCNALQCRTLKVRQSFGTALVAAPCDSAAAQALDGHFDVQNLAQAIAGGDSAGRGYHGGDFVWNGVGAQATGSISGITNASTYRSRVFVPPNCPDEGCRVPDVMEGRFCGTIRTAADARLIDGQVIGTYRLKLTPSATPDQYDLAGTIEGVIVVKCPG
jgi:hypothetical protein